MRLTSALVAGALLALAAVAAPAATPLLPGLGPDDRRVPVDGSAAPWRSLAKVRDAAELIEVDYETLVSVTDTAASSALA